MQQRGRKVVVGLALVASAVLALVAPSSKVDAAEGSIPVASTFAGVDNLSPGADQAPYQLACASPEDCVVDESMSALYFTTDGGESFTAGMIPPSGSSLALPASVTCAPKSEECWAVGGTLITGHTSPFIDYSNNLGATWVPQPVPAAVNSLTSIACASTEVCVAGGDATPSTDATCAVECSEVAFTTDGGTTWTAATIAEDAVVSLSCPSVSTCFALERDVAGSNEGAYVEESTDGGMTWTALSNPDDGWGDSISCGTVSTCVLTGRGDELDGEKGWVSATSDDGATWTTPAMTTAPPIEASCASATECFVADGQLLETTDGGSSWATVISSKKEYLAAVDCAAAGVCFASGATVAEEPVSFLLESRDATGLGCKGTLAGQSVVAAAVTPHESGYWAVSSVGGVVPCGTARFEGSVRGKAIPAPIVGIASATKKNGYYLLGADGTVFNEGPGATTRGSGPRSSSPYVGIAVDQASGGYWLVTAAGKVTAVGARREARTGGSLTGQVAGITAAPEGGGYYLFTNSGAVEAFGTAARFKGDLYTEHVHAGSAISALAVEPDGRGYFLVGRDGGVFRFGAGTTWHGAFTGKASAPVSAALACGFSTGYWLVDQKGAVYSLGAPFYGAPG